MKRKWFVVSDASAPDQEECDLLHFWTPRGLTTGATQPLIETAKRCGWKDTIAVSALTHREAVEKACEAFTKLRRQRQSRKELN